MKEGVNATITCNEETGEERLCSWSDTGLIPEKNSYVDVPSTGKSGYSGADKIIAHHIRSRQMANGFTGHATYDFSTRDKRKGEATVAHGITVFFKYE